MDVSRIRALRGPNLWSRHTAIQAIVTCQGAEVAISDNQETAVKFNVRSIPTIMFFKDGKHVDTVVGADPRIKTILQGKIEQHLG